MRKWRRRLGKAAIFGLLAVLVLLGIGAIYEQASVRKDRKSYTPSGKLYEVDGRKMHVYAGGQGDVTVVFASGWGTANPYVDFYPLYEKLAPHVKFAVYDRFGYGYSDTTDRKRDIDTITDEIHEALKASGQQPPYVFVAHSLGSLETIRYAQRYTDEVKGIVMVDGGSPEYYFDDTEKPPTGGWLSKLFIRTGLVRLLFQSDAAVENSRAARNGLKFVPDELKKIDRTAALLKLDNANMNDELRLSRTNAKVVLDGLKPLPIPLTILTADYFGKADKRWEEFEKAFASWSVQSKQVVVKNTEHYMHQYRPDLVAEEILALAYKR
ncbi:alpha/beta hydrolase [Cohnella soli]|uniref:Alpha/beta fold hydrolase n=1 Tax=Cohnella soli TaxID=425005 RepID=A0ABW0HT12_9BACL